MADALLTIEELEAANKVLLVLSELPPIDRERDRAYENVLVEVQAIIKRARDIDGEA